MKNTTIRTGVLWGVLATIAMTALMLIGRATGLAPMPMPIPVALAALVLGSVARPVLMATGLLAHLAYGGLWGGVLAHLRQRVRIRDGLLLGVGLWLIMQVAVLPLIGWGLFGVGITGMPPAIAVGTLILHLVYGGVLGWGLRRSGRREADSPSHAASV